MQSPEGARGVFGDLDHLIISIFFDLFVILMNNWVVGGGFESGPSSAMPPGALKVFDFLSVPISHY